MQSAGIDDITTHSDPQVTIKEEPIDVKDEVTDEEPKKWLNIEFFPDSIKCEITFEQSCIHQENNAEELVSNTHIGQCKPVGTSLSIKKEEGTTDVEKLVEIEPSYEQSTRSRLRIKKDYSDESKDVGKSSDKIHVEKTKKDDLETTFSCNICSKIFNMKSKLLSHKRSSHSQIKEKQYYYTKMNTETTSIIEEKTIHNQKKKFICHVCGKHLCSNSKLICHIRTHTGEKPFACNVCDKKFNEKSKLLSHIRSSHSQIKEKQYSPTKKNTKTPSIIEENSVHNKKKNFDCHVCDKHLCSNSKLICHIRTHTGEKPFVCNVCDKKFNQKSNLVNHMRTHTGEKPYTCNVCPKQFIIKSNLAVHMRTHTGEKPFACKVCNKQFNQQSNIFNHMKIHTGEKPYACNACPKQFSRNSSLVRHKESSHR